MSSNAEPAGSDARSRARGHSGVPYIWLGALAGLA
jgi:hypothetical protein